MTHHFQHRISLLPRAIVGTKPMPEQQATRQAIGRAIRQGLVERLGDNAKTIPHYTLVSCVDLVLKHYTLFSIALVSQAVAEFEEVYSASDFTPKLFGAMCDALNYAYIASLKSAILAPK